MAERLLFGAVFVLVFTVLITWAVRRWAEAEVTRHRTRDDESISPEPLNRGEWLEAFVAARAAVLVRSQSSLMR